MSSSTDTAWRSALRRIWARAGLGDPPPGGRADRWEVSIDRRTVTFTPTPDERGLIVRAAVRSFPGAQIGPEAALHTLLRGETGFLIGSSGGLRLLERDGALDLVVEDVIFPDLHDDEALDAVISACVERAAFQAARWERAAGPVKSPRRPTRAVRPEADEPFELIFRP